MSGENKTTRDVKVAKAEKLLRHKDGSNVGISVDALARKVRCTRRTAYRILEQIEAAGHTLLRTPGNSRGNNVVRYFLV